jgi:hypothetical protein
MSRRIRNPSPNEEKITPPDLARKFPDAPEQTRRARWAKAGSFLSMGFI